MKKFLFLSLGVLFFLFPSVAHADDTFATSFDVSYTSNQQGNTHVVFNGTLTNSTDKYYASDYAITTGFTDAKNITASDDDGALTPTLTDAADEKKIELTFNHKAMGLGAVVHFTIAFDTTQVATHVGNVWEVAIPGVANQSEFQSFSVHVSVPDSFGQLSLSKPAAINGLTFTKDQLGNGGVFLVFGDAQQFDFNLSYQIKNDNVFPVKTDIALPPDTSYQTVSIDSLNPKPEDVYQDSDGNWLARYFLLPSERLTIVATGSALLHLVPTPQALTAQERAEDLKPQKYWETTDPQIKQLAGQLKTPQNIYQYVVTHLTYDFSRVTSVQQRLGAAYVLEHPDSAVCLEFTDLFIALSRAAGIPAREVDGFAYTQNSKERPLSLLQDILHAWPEYYDDTRGAWIMVDPTWGNTTHGVDYFNSFDFDHVAFVVKGADSGYPIPAGGYKFDDNSRDVNVTPSTVSTVQPAQATFDLSALQQLFPWSPISATLTVTNLGPEVIDGRTITFTSPAVNIVPSWKQVPNIPPMGNQTITLTLKSRPFLTKQDVPVTIQFGTITVVKQLTLYPFAFSRTDIIYGGIALFCIGGLIWIIAAKARRVRLS